MHDSYEHRYTLLRQVVASWSLYLSRKEEQPFEYMPLLMIAQYPMGSLATMFREIVHGAPARFGTHRVLEPWSARTKLPFDREIG